MGQGGEAADGFKDFFNSRIVLVEDHGVISNPNGSLLLQEQPHLVMSISSTLDLGVYGTKVDIMCSGEVSIITKGPSKDSHGSNQEPHPSIERLSRYLSPPLIRKFICFFLIAMKALLHRLLLRHARLATPGGCLCLAGTASVQVLP